MNQQSTGMSWIGLNAKLNAMKKADKNKMAVPNFNRDKKLHNILTYCSCVLEHDSYIDGDCKRCNLCKRILKHKK